MQQTARAFSAPAFLDQGEVTDRIVNVVSEFDKVSADAVTNTAHFVNDLGLDSLDAVEVVMAIEEEFAVEIPDDQAEKILSISDAVEFISAHPQAK